MRVNDYPPEYDQEQLDNQYFAKAFPDAKGLGDLYRQTYKYTACGPWLSARIQYIKVIESDGYGGDMPYEKEVVEWVHSDDLYSLGTWADMDSQGVLVTALMVGSIVEGCDQGTDQHELGVKQLDEEPDVFAKRFDDAVEAVNAEANSIWNDTHGCEIRKEKRGDVMNVYQFKCVVWVRGETPEEALKHLHDEVEYHFSQDNNLIALESDEGELCEEEK